MGIHARQAPKHCKKEQKERTVSREVAHVLNSFYISLPIGLYFKLVQDIVLSARGIVSENFTFKMKEFK